MLHNTQFYCSEKDRTGSRGQAAGRRDLNCQQPLLDKIKNFIFSICYDESKSLKTRTDNLIKITEIMNTIINAHVTEGSKIEAAQKSFGAITDRLYEIQEKMINNLPINYNSALKDRCDEIVDSINTHLLTFDIEEKQSIYQKIFNKISSLFSDSKLSDVQLAQKLMLRDPILKEKASLLKAKNQAIKADKTEKEPEITSEQINNVKPL